MREHIGGVGLIAVLSVVSFAAPAGAQVYIIQDINPGASNSVSRGPTAVIGATTYFIADDGVDGMELWKSDGTLAGTVMVKDIMPGNAITTPPRELTVVAGTLYFDADDGVHGDELWKSDGTPEGTVMVKDIAPGATGGNLESLTAFGNT